MALAYDLTPFSPQTGDMRQCARFRCAECGREEKVPVVHKGNNPEWIVKKFTQLRWDVDQHNARKCLCPGCVEKRKVRIAAEREAELALKPPPLPPMPTARAPKHFVKADEVVATVTAINTNPFHALQAGTRASTSKGDQMDIKKLAPEHKAALRRELDAGFDDATGQYLDGYSDHIISEKLQIPRKLVEEFRDASYGELREDPETAAIRDQIAQINKVLSNLQSTVQKLNERFDALVQKKGHK